MTSSFLYEASLDIVLCVGQSVTCLATDASLTADPGVPSLIPARSHTFVEIDHEIISTTMANRLFERVQEKVWLHGLTFPP